MPPAKERSTGAGDTYTPGVLCADSQDIRRQGPCETSKGHLHVSGWLLFVVELMQPYHIIFWDVFLVLLSFDCESVRHPQETHGVV